MRLAVLMASLLAVSPSAASTREEWIAWMRGAVPAFFCHPNHMYRRCAGVSEAECRRNATAALEQCLAKRGSDIPSQITTYADDLKMQEVIGGCAGKGYMDRDLVRPRLAHSPECAMAQRKLAGGP